MKDRTYQIVAVASLAVLVVGHSLMGGMNDSMSQNGESMSRVPSGIGSLVPTASAATFDYLSGQTTNSCGGGKSAVYGLLESGRMQGSCCGKMSEHAYQEQLEGLKKFGQYDVVPKNPYDVPVEWAKTMIEYGEQTQLDANQQAVYDQGVELSDEGGPCCCVCWHWYAYEGLAKYLIINENFSAEQVAELWGLSDACGGEHGH